MTQDELNEKLTSIRGNMKMLDTIIHHAMRPEDPDKPYCLSADQAEKLQEILDVFQAMGWALALSRYRDIDYQGDSPIKPGLFGHKPGTPVRVRPCGDEYPDDKTYFGILIGDVATGVGHMVKDSTLIARLSGYNPAIIIPELGKVVFGYESWWGVIESEEDMDKLITDETIRNVWYVKAIKEMSHVGQTEGDCVGEAEDGTEASSAQAPEETPEA